MEKGEGYDDTLSCIAVSISFSQTMRGLNHIDVKNFIQID